MSVTSQELYGTSLSTAPLTSFSNSSCDIKVLKNEDGKKSYGVLSFYSIPNVNNFLNGRSINDLSNIALNSFYINTHWDEKLGKNISTQDYESLIARIHKLTPSQQATLQKLLQSQTTVPANATKAPHLYDSSWCCGSERFNPTRYEFLTGQTIGRSEHCMQCEELTVSSVSHAIDATSDFFPLFCQRIFAGVKDGLSGHLTRREHIHNFRDK